MDRLLTCIRDYELRPCSIGINRFWLVWLVEFFRVLLGGNRFRLVWLFNFFNQLWAWLKRLKTMGRVRWLASEHPFSCFASLFLCVNCSNVLVVTMKLSTNKDDALFKRRFQNLDMREFSRFIWYNHKHDQNMLLNILIHWPIHNAAEPILWPVLERQLKQQVGLSPSCQPWQKKLRKSENDYVLSQPHVNQKRLKKCSIREP